MFLCENYNANNQLRFISSYTGCKTVTGDETGFNPEWKQIYFRYECISEDGFTVVPSNSYFIR